MLQHVLVVHSFRGQIPNSRYDLIIHLSIDGHSFHLLHIIKNAAVNIHMQVFVWMYIFSSIGYMIRSGIAKSNGNSV